MTDRRDLALFQFPFYIESRKINISSNGILYRSHVVSRDHVVFRNSHLFLYIQWRSCPLSIRLEQ